MKRAKMDQSVASENTLLSQTANECSNFELTVTFSTVAHCPYEDRQYCKNKSLIFIV